MLIKNTGLRKFVIFIYSAIPFKKFIYELLRKTSFRKTSIAHNLFFKGYFESSLPNGRRFTMFNEGYRHHIENLLFWRGVEDGWEKMSTRVWLELAKSSKVILDIGANSGYYSLIAKGINEQAQVLAFEPMPVIYDKLNNNISKSNMKIKTEKIALSNAIKKSILKPQSKDTHYTLSISDNNSYSNDEAGTEVSVTRLDEYIKENNIPEINLMKIDVESHEVEVLEGMGHYLQKMKPNMLIEVQNDAIASKLNKLMEGMEYQYFNIDENLGFKKVSGLCKSSTLNFLVCDTHFANNSTVLKKYAY